MSASDDELIEAILDLSETIAPYLDDTRRTISQRSDGMPLSPVEVIVLYWILRDSPISVRNMHDSPHTAAKLSEAARSLRRRGLIESDTPNSTVDTQYTATDAGSALRVAWREALGSHLRYALTGLSTDERSRFGSASDAVRRMAAGLGFRQSRSKAGLAARSRKHS